MSKPCTSCVFIDLISKICKVYFSLYNTVWLTNLFKKRRNIVLNIGFQIEKKCELPTEKRKTKSWECDWAYSSFGILKTSIVPYISLSEKHCCKVIIFHSFESEWFCPNLGDKDGECVHKLLLCNRLPV